MVDYRSMPTDLAELYSDLEAADANNDTETARIIATRISQVESSQPYDIAEDTSKTEQFLIGAGRGIMDIAQGAKQKYLMATDPERAEEYTEQINEEVSRFEEDFPGIGAESLGRFAGWAAPGALIPGAGVAGTAALGGLEAGIMPTQSADFGEAGVQAGVGALTGGLLRGAPALAGKFKTPRPNTPDKLAAAQYAAERGIPLRPSHLTDSANVRSLTNIADATPGVKSAERTLEDAATESRRLAERYRPADLQEEYITGMGRLREAETSIWNQADEVMGSTRVNADGIVDQMARELGRLKETGGNSAQITRLEKLFDDLPAGVLEDGTTSWSNLKEFRSNFAAANAPKFGEIGMTPAIAKRMYGAITKELQRGAKAHGKPGEALFNKAVDATKKRRSLEKQAGVPKAVARGDIEGGSKIERIAMGSDRDRVNALRQIMTNEGSEGVKSLIFNTIHDAATSGQRIYGPGSAAQKSRQLMKSAKQFLNKDEIAELEGFTAFMDSIKKEAATVANPPTGQKMLGPGMTATGVLGGPKAWAMMTVAPALMRRRDVSAMLQKLSKEKDGTPLHRALTDELKAIFTQGAAAGAPQLPPEIEIRNGVSP